MHARRIGIFGAGAVGSYLGGLLAAAGEDVTFVGRLGPEVAERGLTLSDYGGRYVRLAPERVHYFADPSAIARCAVVLVTVKSMATEDAARTLERVLLQPTAVVSFQNGVTNASVLRGILRGHTVIAGMVPFNVRREEGARFHQATSGALMLEQVRGREKPIAHALRRARLEVERRRDLIRVQYSKLIINLNNSVNALAGVPLREELAQRAYRSVLAGAMREAVACMSAAGIRPARVGVMIPRLMPRFLELPDALFSRAAKSAFAIDETATSSMLEDLERGRTTEIDYLNGEIVRLSDRTGVPAPINRAIVALVKEAQEARGGSPKLAARELLARVMP